MGNNNSTTTTRDSSSPQFLTSFSNIKSAQPNQQQSTGGTSGNNQLNEIISLVAQIQQLEARQSELADRLCSKRAEAETEKIKCDLRVDKLSKEVIEAQEAMASEIKNGYGVELKTLSDNLSRKLSSQVSQLTSVTFAERKLFMLEDVRSHAQCMVENNWEERLKELDQQWERSLKYTLEVSKEEHEKVYRQTIDIYKNELAAMEQKVPT
jgi:hypothetical protein